jgi:hypothetical protein
LKLDFAVQRDSADLDPGHRRVAGAQDAFFKAGSHQDLHFAHVVASDDHGCASE